MVIDKMVGVLDYLPGVSFAQFIMELRAKLDSVVNLCW